MRTRGKAWAVVWKWVDWGGLPRRERWSIADPRSPTSDVTWSKRGTIPKQAKLPSVTDLASCVRGRGRLASSSRKEGCQIAARRRRDTYLTLWRQSPYELPSHKVGKMAGKKKKREQKKKAKSSASARVKA